MHHDEFETPEELRDTIKCFWYTKRDFGAVESGYEILPDGYAEIIFHFGSACNISYDGYRQALPSPCMMGLLNQPVVLYTKDIFKVIGVRCYPWTVFDLLSIPPGKTNANILEHPIAKLQPILNKLIQADKIGEVLAIIEQYFIGVRSRIASDSMLFKAGVALTKAKGSLPVSGVAAAAHATVRTLERKFKERSGYSVKDVSGVMRFEQVRNELWIQPTCNLAGLAHELGYSDQSHLSREFKRYSGTTPAAFARNARKRKLTFNNDFVAFVQD
jgi:AraC-like DNA-binding protein